MAGFRLYFAAQTLSACGFWFQVVALNWSVLQTEHSALALAFIVACQTLPQLVFGLFAGVVIDRLDARRVCITTQLLQVGFGLCLALVVGRVPLGFVGALLVLRGINVAFTSNSQQKVVYDFVGPDRLKGALSAFASVNAVLLVVGPALAGVALTAWGVTTSLLINAASYLAVVVSLITISQGPGLKSEKASVAEGLREGARYVSSRPHLVRLLILGFAFSVSASSTVLFAVLARTTLGGTAGILGMLYAAAGVGSGIGSLIAARARVDQRALQYVSLATVATAYALLAFSSKIVPALGIVTLLGIASTTFLIVNQTLYRMEVPMVLQARVSSLYSTAMLGGQVVSATLSGQITQMGGTRSAYISAAILLATTVLLVILSERYSATAA